MTTNLLALRRATSELDIEIWPTCIVVPPGYRLALTIRGNDYDHGLNPGGPTKGNRRLQGVGPFTHDYADDRLRELSSGRNKQHSTPAEHRSFCYSSIPSLPPDLNHVDASSDG